MNLPYAQAAEQNKAAILQAIRPYLRGKVLEIGSGTGQHAVYFASLLPELYRCAIDLKWSQRCNITWRSRVRWRWMAAV